MKITIPKPCHENWDAMTPDEKGRFCSVCSVSVQDFTNCSDEEIVNEFSQKSGKICGRFSNEQIHKNFSFSVWSKIALGLLVGGGTSAMMNAQEFRGEEVKKVDFKKRLHGVEVINDTINRTTWLGMPSQKDIESTQPIIFLDGIQISEAKMKKLKSEEIESVQVLSGVGAKQKFGNKGEYGVILIERKK